MQVAQPPEQGAPGEQGIPGEGGQTLSASPASPALSQVPINAGAAMPQ